MTNLKSKTSRILVVLVSLFMLFTVLGCMTFSASATSVKPTVESFQMINGASIRTVYENETGVENGIRFSAELSVNDYNTLSAYEDVTVGTFVMPLSYYQKKPINEANCFGTGSVYTWADKGVNDGVEILHIPGKLYQTDSEIVAGATVYRINGSVVNMKEENLDRTYIGVSYIKVSDGTNVYYYFAETSVDASRSIVDVSQNILIAEDEEYSDAATGILNRYLTANDGSVSAKVIEEVYVNSSTGYEKAETKVNEVTLTTASDFTKTYGAIPEKDGYLHITAKQGQTSSVARTGEDVTLKYYFDKKIADVIILDSSNVKEGQNIYTAHGITELGGTGSSLTEDSNWGYHGNHSIKYNDYYNTVAGIIFAEPVVLPAPTRTISFMVKNDKNNVGNGVDTNTVLVFDKDNVEIGRTTFVPNNEPSKVYEVSITLSKDITTIGQIRFSADDAGTGGDYNPMYIDYIHAEYDLLALGIDNIEMLESGDKKLELDIKSKIISTKLSDKEITDGLVITAKELPNGTATTLTANEQGKYELNAADGINYEVEYSVTAGGNSVSGKFFVLGYINGWKESFEGTNGTVSSLAKLVDNSLDGSNALTTKSTSNSNYANFVYAELISNTTQYTTLCFWAYSVSDYTPGGVCIFIQDHEKTIFYAENTTIKAGWNYYELKIRNNGVMKRDIMSVGFAGWQISPVGTVIIDRMSLKP